MRKKAVKEKINVNEEVITGEEKPAFQSTGFFNRAWSFLRSNPALIMLVALVIFGRITSPVFLTHQNLLNTIWIVSVLGYSFSRSDFVIDYRQF